MSLKLGLQLYTMRDDVNGDFIGMLEKVREVGYEGVEFAGFYDIPAEEMKAALDRLGLTAVGSHESFERVVEKADEVIAYNKAIGNNKIVIPWLTTNDPAELQKVIEGVQSVEKKYADAGMVLCYHNHRHDFETVDGVYCIEKFLDAVKTVQYEIDAYWTGIMLDDVPGYLRAKKDRMALLHMKDGAGVSDPENLCAIGEGTEDIQGLLDAAKEIGLEWVIVENDFPKPDGLTNIKKSMENLQTKYSL